LLLKELPNLPGWNLAAYYQPARAVGGDFYDFLSLPDGRLALIIGDVTDKGVPAAIVMATTRSVLRSASETSTNPGDVLERANNLLCPDIPEKMFITCLYAVLDPRTGRLVYANAGHDLPYRRCATGVDELRAVGMPLGLMEDMTYEQKEVQLSPGDSILFYSDGLVEAHNPQGEMFGFPRLRERLAEHPGGPSVIEYLLGDLYNFTQPGWEQEDDVTFLAIQWTEAVMPANTANDSSEVTASRQPEWRLLDEFEVASQPGNERQVMEKVGQAALAAGMPVSQIERLKTAASEAAMNAMEHGNHYSPDLPVSVRVLSSGEAVSVQITDRGSGEQIPEPELPDLDAKLAGLQTPRGWGLFLIKNMVDEMNVTSEEHFHQVELIMNFKGEEK
jgi:anti-sigma regulatory factor (Ser/Thr protein kinase)